METHLWLRRCDHTSCRMGKFDKDGTPGYLFLQQVGQSLKVWNPTAACKSGAKSHKVHFDKRSTKVGVCT